MPSVWIWRGGLRRAGARSECGRSWATPSGVGERCGWTMRPVDGHPGHDGRRYDARHPRRRLRSHGPARPSRRVCWRPCTPDGGGPQPRPAAGPSKRCARWGPSPNVSWPSLALACTRPATRWRSMSRALARAVAPISSPVRWLGRQWTGRWRVDLMAANQQQLVLAGVAPSRIFDCGVTTADDDYFSDRAARPCGRFCPACPPRRAFGTDGPRRNHRPVAWGARCHLPRNVPNSSRYDGYTHRSHAGRGALHLFDRRLHVHRTLRVRA